MSYIFLLLSLHVFADESFSIKPQGRITIKSDKSIFSANCKAERYWPVITGLKDKKIESKLNSEFLKILSVGKKIKPDDCPGKSSNEDYTYINNTFIGAQRGTFLGIEFRIYFPGGSGRIFNDCRIYDLKTGNVYRPETHRLPGASEYVRRIFKERNKITLAETEPENLSEIESGRPSPFCLGKDGMEVRRHAFALNEIRVLLTKEDAEKIFKMTPEIVAIFFPDEGRSMNSKAAKIPFVPGKSLDDISIGETTDSLRRKNFVTDNSREGNYLKRDDFLVRLNDDRVVQIWYSGDLQNLRLGKRQLPSGKDLQTYAKFFNSCEQIIQGSGGQVLYCENRGVEITTSKIDDEIGFSVIGLGEKKN